MNERAAIAVLTRNVLAGMGLRAILEKVAPAASVELYGDFGAFAADTPERFVHLFVSAQFFAAHEAFFRAHNHRTVLLTAGQTFAGMHCLDMNTSEEEFVHALMRLQRSARRPEHVLPESERSAKPLTGREAEVLSLVARGLSSKQIALRLGIGLTTVLSHRRNIAQKTGIRSVAGLAVYALTAGYVDGEGL